MQQSTGQSRGLGPLLAGLGGVVSDGASVESREVAAGEPGERVVVTAGLGGSWPCVHGGCVIPGSRQGTRGTEGAGWWHRQARHCRREGERSLRLGTPVSQLFLEGGKEGPGRPVLAVGRRWSRSASGQGCDVPHVVPSRAWSAVSCVM